MGFLAQLLGKEEAKEGFYKAQQFYQPPNASQLKPTIYARDGYGGIACERVTPLTGRTHKQWAATMVGVFCTGVAVFVSLAVIKKDEKFHAQFIQPIKNMIT